MTGSSQVPGDEPLLKVEGLRTHFGRGEREFRAVDGVSFALRRGEILGIVGESGCGKSVTSLSIMRLIPDPPGRIAGGAIWFEGEDLTQKSQEEMRRIRGNKISMIFQEPMTSLNPVYTVGDQIVEGIRLHRDVTAEEARERTIEMLRLVRIPSPEKRVDDYPHQLSGGMRQRVMIAMALACEPRLLIADEPTTALDVTIQAQILDLMRRLRTETGTSIMLITHSLGVIAEMADSVVVMYAGRIVEKTDVRTLFADPQHPYTLGLLGSIPKLAVDEERLATIPGTVPNPQSMPSGCLFNPRCPIAVDKCRAEVPPLIEIAPGHLTACWRAPLPSGAA
jgi:peptide/nickel transport system ATP-binding protein